MTYNKKWYKEYAKRNREKLNAQQRKWSKENRQKRNKIEKAWKDKNKEKVKILKKRYYLKNKKEIILKIKQNRIKNYERDSRIRKEKSEYNKRKKAEINESKKEERKIKRKKQLQDYYLKNKDHLDKCRRIRIKMRRLNDINYRINSNIGTDIWHALKRKKAGKKWQSLVGYELKDLKYHLENQFDKNMNWDNYGSYWEIDHIKPRSLFKFSTYMDDEFKKCWALKNLQPLEKIRNRQKGNKYAII